MLCCSRSAAAYLRHHIVAPNHGEEVVGVPVIVVEVVRIRIQSTKANTKVSMRM